MMGLAFMDRQDARGNQLSISYKRKDILARFGQILMSDCRGWPFWHNSRRNYSVKMQFSDTPSSSYVSLSGAEEVGGAWIDHGSRDRCRKKSPGALPF